MAVWRAHAEKPMESLKTTPRILQHLMSCLCASRDGQLMQLADDAAHVCSCCSGNSGAEAGTDGKEKCALDGAGWRRAFHRAKFSL